MNICLSKVDITLAAPFAVFSEQQVGTAARRIPHGTCHEVARPSALHHSSRNEAAFTSNPPIPSVIQCRSRSRPGEY